MLNPWYYGAGGRNRTGTELPPEDFESSASTSFTTPAHKIECICKSKIKVNKDGGILAISIIQTLENIGGGDCPLP